MININTSMREKITLVEVSGRIDSMNANQLGEALANELNNGHTNMVLDLANVEYMRSAGLREIVSALNNW